MSLRGWHTNSQILPKNEFYSVSISTNNEEKTTLMTTMSVVQDTFFVRTSSFFVYRANFHKACKHNKLAKHRIVMPSRNRLPAASLHY